MGANLSFPPTPAQAHALQLTRTIASIPSIIGASYIIQHVLWSKKRRQRVLTRLLLGKSCMDLLFSLTSVFSSTIMPKELNYPFPSSWAAGNWATCTAFGFLGRASSLSSVLYSASLSLFYILTIRDGWSEWKIAHASGIEPFLHALPLLIGWILSIPGIFLKLYNPLVTGCFIAGFPRACETDRNPKPCQRGTHSHLYRLFFDLWVWSVFLFLVVSMTLIYMKLAKIDRRSTPRSFHFPSSSAAMHGSSSSLQIRRNSRERESNHPAQSTTTQGRSTLNRLKHEFAAQALLFCLAFIMTWFFVTLGNILRDWTQAPNSLPFAFLANITAPLQGFWNAFIYIRPRYLRYRRKQRKEEEAERQERQRQAQECQEETHRARILMAQQAAHARLAATNRGMAFLHAFSAKVEYKDEEDEDYMLDKNEDEEDNKAPPPPQPESSNSNHDDPPLE